MKKIFLVTLCFFIQILFIRAQTAYTSYTIGSMSDVSTISQNGICLMGGAGEDDNAMRWFLNRSGGGDIVVIRSTGGDGYNSYIYSGLGVTVNSVETIVINSISAANDPYVRQQLRNAEAVFIAGGNQYDYVSYWKNTAVDSALNYLIHTKHCPIGGTSAGMAIQGQSYFTAAVASITSATALSNPYHPSLTLGNNDFIHHPILKRVITDTHFDSPDRKGRITTFLARLYQDSTISFFGIACDEYTAVCIDEFGIAKVYGGFPTYDDNAYFIQTNCLLPNSPEVCTSGTPLNWNRSNSALKVYNIKGNAAASNSFNLNTWLTGSGGTWQDWYVISGSINYNTSASAISCLTTDLYENNDYNSVSLYPNPTQGIVYIKNETDISSIKVYNHLNQLILEEHKNTNYIDLSNYNNGIYYIKIYKKNANCILLKTLLNN